jgi:hypothetical protein
VLILFYRRLFSGLGYSRNPTYSTCCLCLFQCRVAGLLRPRPFLNKLSIVQRSRKFCERQSGSHFSSFLHMLPLKQYNGWISNEKYEKTNYSTVNACGLAIFTNFNFIGSSVIYLSLSERQYGLSNYLTSRGFSWSILAISHYAVNLCWSISAAQWKISIRGTMTTLQKPAMLCLCT